MIHDVAFVTAWPASLDSSEVREILNGIWFCLDIVMGATFGRRIFLDIRANRGAFRSNQVTQAAIAMCVFLAGATIYRAWTWALLFAQANETDAVFFGRYLFIPVVAATVGVIGSSCVVRVFTPERLNPWLWVSCAAASVAIPLLVHAIFFPL